MKNFKLFIVIFLFLILFFNTSPKTIGVLNPISKFTAFSRIFVTILQGNLEDIKEDYNNGYYNIFNDSENVINTKTIGFYKGSTIVKQNVVGTCSIFGTIWVNGYFDNNALHHEYGHSIQEQKLKTKYISRIAIPSVLYYFYDIRNNGNNYDYYSTPWERTADWLGGVQYNEGYKKNSLKWGLAENIIGPIVIPFYFIFGY